jgi:S-adenosylmethionine synthetase
VSVSVDTFCTGKADEEKLERAIWEVFNFKPAEIIKQLNLLRPIYRKTTNYGHFGRIDDLDALTWERTDKADELRKAAS